MENKMNEYYETMQRGIDHNVVLTQAKETLDAGVYKLLMLMLQMRGQFNSKGVPMLSRGMQTVGPMTSESA